MRAGEVELELADPPVGVSLEVRPAQCLGDIARPARAEVRGTGTLETVDGWPVTILRFDRDGAACVHALFAIDERGIVVVARGSNLDAQREELLAMFRSARVRFAETIAALADVWGTA